MLGLCIGGDLAIWSAVWIGRLCIAGFVKQGHKLHEGIAGELVTLQEYQQGIRFLQDLGNAGIHETQSTNERDYR